MNFLVRRNSPISFFDRSVESIINDGFFTSFDTNIKEFENHYMLHVAVPGMKKEDLNIELSNNVLRVFGEKKNHFQHERSNYAEFSSTQFSRSFILPQDINAETISADCNDGLLRITLKKKQSGSSVTKIKINDSKEKKKGFFQGILNKFRKG